MGEEGRRRLPEELIFNRFLQSGSGVFTTRRQHVRKPTVRTSILVDGLGSPKANRDKHLGAHRKLAWGDSRAGNENSKLTTERCAGEPVGLVATWSSTPLGVPEESLKSASELSHQRAGMQGVGFTNSFYLLAKGACGWFSQGCVF